jgi:putative membrane protein
MISHRRVLVVAGLICLGLFSLACENGNPSGSSQPGTMNANKAGTTASQLTESDRAFAMKAATGGKHEVELGQLAATRASNSDVKAFANRMVQDHSRAGEELTQINARLAISPPAEEDALFKQTFDRLSKLKAVDFDQAYMKEMVEGHTKVADERSSYVSSGTNPDLKAWASKTLPTVREHLQMAKDIANKIGGQMK